MNEDNNQRSSGLTTLERSKENKHHPDKLKTNAYFPSFPPCFKPAQPLTKDTHEPVEKDPNDVNLYAHTSSEDEEKKTSKIPGISFETEKEEEDSSKTLPCQLPPNEMNPGSFTLSCTIGNFKLYAMADIGVGVNGIGEEKVKFDMNGGICHFRVPVEIFYMESSVKECENFNLLKLKMMYSLMIPLRACYWSKVPLHVVRKAWTLLIQVMMCRMLKGISQVMILATVPTCNPDLSFCSGYDAIYGHEESSIYKEMEFEVSSTPFHVVARFCLCVTTLVTP
ncbi:hypothetical protein Tco_0736494 [Tanacetum coccineum]